MLIYPRPGIFKCGEKRFFFESLRAGGVCVRLLFSFAFEWVRGKGITRRICGAMKVLNDDARGVCVLFAAGTFYY